MANNNDIFYNLESSANYYYDFLGCFSVPANNKTPCISWTDINTIEKCISNFKKNAPAKQIALVANGRFVTIDFDTVEFFEEFMRKIGKIEGLWIVKTIRGYHIHFRSSINIKNWTTTKFEVIAEKHLVTMPPSRYEGGVYEFMNEPFENLEESDEFKVDWIMSKLNEMIETEKEKKKLVLPQEGRSVGEFASELGDYFSKKSILFYRPVDWSVVKLDMCAINEEKDRKILAFKPIKNTEFITFIENHFDVGINKHDRENNTYFKTKSISSNIAEATLVSEYQFRQKLPVIDRIYNVPMPCLKADRLIFPKTEYDSDLKSYLSPNAPTINVNMTLDEAEEIIKKMYKEFCFLTNQDRINAISALLTPFCRGLYKNKTCRTPIFFYKANRERAGKDYCAGITGIVYEDTAIEDPPFVSEREIHDDELRKKILSTFKSGRNRIHSSNNKGHINSASLESLSTSEHWEDRQLGSNLMLTYPNTLEISLSANTGITYTPDLAARCIFINLFFVEEDPNRRMFEEPDLHGWVKEHRSEVVSALYALVKNWKDKGMPVGGIAFASYPEWARVVGGIMESAGYGSPCVLNDTNDSIGGDKETKNMKTLFELCYVKWPEEWIYKKQVMDEITNQESEFSDLFVWFDWIGKERQSRTKFGLLLDKFKGRELSGIKLNWVDDKTHSTRNKYMWTKGKPKQQGLATMATLDTFNRPPHSDNEIKEAGIKDSQGVQSVQV